MQIPGACPQRVWGAGCPGLLRLLVHRWNSKPHWPSITISIIVCWRMEKTLRSGWAGSSFNTIITTAIKDDFKNKKREKGISNGFLVRSNFIRWPIVNGSWPRILENALQCSMRPWLCYYILVDLALHGWSESAELYLLWLPFLLSLLWIIVLFT